MPARVRLLVWYDTEDYVAPESDDAALFLAQLHTRLEFPATFKLVGEKARRLYARGRADVLRALGAHDIGYHTNYHSRHPVITEYCEALDWPRAELRFWREEKPGYDDVARLFDKPVLCYGQPGGAWAPQALPMLRQWGVRAYVDEGPWIGMDGHPFWLMGLLFVTRMGPNLQRYRVNQPGDELEGVTRFRVAARRLQKQGGGVISVYFHPCELSTDAFWDGVNFARGANPPLNALRQPPLPSPAERNRRYAAMETYLTQLRASEVTPIGTAELLSLYRDRAVGRSYTRDELIEATAEWTDSVDYVAVDGGWLTAAELLTAVADLLRPDDIVPPADHSRLAVPLSVDGPHSDAKRLRRRVSVRFEDLVAGAQALLDRCHLARRLPDAPEWLVPTPGLPPLTLPAAVPVGALNLRPEEFLLAGLRALRSTATAGTPPDEVDATPVDFRPARHVTDEPNPFHWVIFPDGFKAPGVMRHTRRQAWTIKPAALTP
ncbi:MAG: hypothetical protein HYU66_26600 [Armatimonadetes bacterium]|nr:hypothetical protein [Armatimonadota bacterium]